MIYASLILLFFFFFNDTATTEIYTLSLHDALPISRRPRRPAPGRDSSPRPRGARCAARRRARAARGIPGAADRKSTRLNSSHLVISYAVFCLKKKKTKKLQSSRQACVSKLSTYVYT